ncbi:MAG: hypothetical protein Q9200_004454 [Gallowayella weberi]
MVSSCPRIIYGTSTVSKLSPEELRGTLDTLEEYHVKSLDTAFVYPGSEATLGAIDAAKKFDIHTKAPSLAPACQSRQSILDGMDKSLKELKATSIDLYYLHGPDVTTPIEETLSAIQELYAAGKFKRASCSLPFPPKSAAIFGISNYLAPDVQKIHDIQTASKSILPTVYQGNYNAVARRNELDLIPLLRKLNMSFYAYSPIAGGFLAKDMTQIKSNLSEGRFSGKSLSGEMYQALYGKDAMYEALDAWNEIANAAGISTSALAYRWITYHSALGTGDGTVIGARNPEQLRQTLEAIAAGPLDDAVADRASGVWDTVKGVAPRDNWNDYLSLR